MILVRDTGEVLRGRFEELASAHVTLRVEPTGPASAPRQLGVCCVSFVHDERAFVFLAPLWRLVDAPDAGKGKLLSVGMPGQMATLDLGSARRIPMPPGAEPEVQVATYDRRAWRPQAVDVSATGILLDFGDERPPRLPLGALVEISLGFGGACAALTAAVRRCDGARVALSFVREATDARAAGAGGSTRSSKRWRSAGWPTPPAEPRLPQPSSPR